jgi:hypothetical protein
VGTSSDSVPNMHIFALPQSGHSNCPVIQASVLMYCVITNISNKCFWSDLKIYKLAVVKSNPYFQNIFICERLEAAIFEIVKTTTFGLSGNHLRPSSWQIC